MAMSLGRRIAILVVTTLMALMMVAGPVSSKAKCTSELCPVSPKELGNNKGWGDGTGGGEIHPKKNRSGPGTPLP